MLTTSFLHVYTASAYFLSIVGCTMLSRNWRKTDFEMELDENHIIGTAISSFFVFFFFKHV